MATKSVYDVVISGASIAGCSAAMHYGRAGLRVALLERSRDRNAHKAMCGHYILGGTRPALERLGVLDAMRAAGAEESWLSIWVESGWIERDRSEVPPAISLRRKVLDPLLREVAASTPGVELHMGTPVDAVTRDGDGRVTGVGAGGREFAGTLVVGADGHRSPVATLAGIPAETAPIPRFFWWAYYEGIERATGAAYAWAIDEDMYVMVPAGNGLTLLGSFPGKARLDEYHADRVGALERRFSSLPEGPDLSRAVRVSPAVGTSDYPFLKREPVHPGLALIGDAAMAADPTPAVGCGWAFRSAEWLADATIPALTGGGDVDAALEDYRAARAIAHAYEDVTGPAAPSPESLAMQKAIRRLAVSDRDVGTRLGLFAMRAAPVSVLLNPDVFGRALAPTG